MSKNGGHKSSGYRSYSSGSSGNRSSGSHSSGSRSHGNKSSGCHSQANKSSGCCNHDSNSHVQKILSKIGVGTPNIRIHFDGTSHIGVFLGITDGSVVLNVKGVVSYINIGSITAVDIGFIQHKKRKVRHKCS